MDDRNRRSWRVATDKLGPGTAIRPRLSRRGIGGFLFVGGNPVSFTVDPILGCIPILSLQGGRDTQSQATRDALLAQGEGSAVTIPGLGSLVGPGAVSTSNTPGTSGNPGATQGTPSSVPQSKPGGPFAYIGASKSGSY